MKLGKEIYAEALLAQLGSRGYPRLMEADSGEQAVSQAICPGSSRSLVIRDKVARTQVRKWGQLQAVELSVWRTLQHRVYELT